MARTPVASTKVERIERERREVCSDLVAVEEPLQIILEYGEAHRRRETPLAMRMRTPRHDHELVTGFLYAEGVVAGVCPRPAICCQSQPTLSTHKAKPNQAARHNARRQGAAWHQASTTQTPVAPSQLPVQPSGSMQAS